MALPRTVTVVGTLTRPDGQPESGIVRFTQRAFLRSSVDDGLVAPGTRVGRLDAGGHLTITGLYANDDPDWSPQGWSYGVELVLSGSRLTYDVQIPYQAAAVELADLLPVVATSGVVYAPVAHTHDGFVSDEQLVDYVEQALADYAADDHTHPYAAAGHTHAGTYATLQQLAEAVADLATVDDVAAVQDTAEGAASLAAAALPRNGPEIVDGTFVVRKANHSSAVRWRSTGGAVDLDIHGALILGYFAGEQFEGDGTPLMRWHGGGTTLAKLTEFGTSVYGGDQFVDPDNGRAGFGGKHGAHVLKFCGRWRAVGAPNAGFWDTDDVVLSNDGWYECTASGDPGTWAKRA